VIQFPLLNRFSAPTPLEAKNVTVINPTVSIIFSHDLPFPGGRSRYSRISVIHVIKPAHDRYKSHNTTCKMTAFLASSGCADSPDEAAKRFPCLLTAQRKVTPVILHRVAPDYSTQG
jgi:hypothetical protein